MKLFHILLLVIIISCGPAGSHQNLSDNRQEFNHFIESIESEYIYKDEKSSILDCIKEKYAKDVDTISKPYFKVLYYESILNEFCDSHISLNTNTDKSYRLQSPIYIQEKDKKFYIRNVFSSQIEDEIDPRYS